MENSTVDSTEANFPEYSMLGTELTTFILQAGFVEGIIAEAKVFHDTSEAYQHIFRNNREYAVILWNGVPIRLSYIDDIPFMVNHLIEFLGAIQSNSKSAQLSLATKNTEWQWEANQENGVLTLQSNFIRLPGNYETAFEPLQLLKMETKQFLNEWKLLLEQLETAMKQSGCEVSSKTGQQALKRLKNLNKGILGSGFLYP